ncbi:hypothetical protein [Nocardia sp. AG03]|uniref:hypothetical protein n=1 Tax=Nocardia sp. AG03 TaxID=3025312 RepID=UPI00241818F9|nr:hypothetical protein [Nocardia sp. AG03]
MTVTPAPRPLPDLSRFGGGTWQGYPREYHGTPYTAYRAVLPGRLFAIDPDQECPVCNSDCYASAVYGCPLCDNDICHACGFAYHGTDPS